MQSFIIPNNIKISITKNYRKREGPQGFFYKKIDGLIFHQINTFQGKRLFIKNTSFISASTILSHIYRLCIGLSRGFRRRLRLVGVGFRASIQSRTSNIYIKTPKIKKTRYIPKYRYNFLSKSAFIQKRLILKIGYSHESGYPLINKNIFKLDIQTSRLEGRSKGTIISRKSNDKSYINQIASDIRFFRKPDIYKGKGIHYNSEIIKFKKGKRQG